MLDLVHQVHWWIFLWEKYESMVGIKSCTYINDDSGFVSILEESKSNHSSKKEINDLCKIMGA
jgi:hypothetical protein